MLIILYIIAAVVFTGGAVFFLSSRKIQQLQAEKSVLEASAKMHASENEKLLMQLQASRTEIISLSREGTQYQEMARSLREKLSEQKLETEKLQERFAQQFEILAQKILNDNSEKLQKGNQETLGFLLNPLKEKLTEFEEKIRVTHKESSEQHASLREQIGLIRELGMQMSEEARGLAKALKGDTKKQGNWGELILSRILEASGLEEGREYSLQGKGMGLKDEEGNRQLPDVIIHLPQEKHIVIDSKVSLSAYEELIREEAEDNRKEHLKKHIESVKKHIQGLGDKYYHQNEKLNSPDFVLMFLPLEASFSIAMQSDGQIFEFAWSKRIILVTPTTLLATLKTVASVWKYEKQNANAMEVARLGGLLYDQFVDFVSEMEKIRKGIEGASTAYDEAMKRLVYNNTSLVRRAERLRQLGVKNKKILSTFQSDLPEVITDDEEEDIITID